jgi:hypothetical protein
MAEGTPGYTSGKLPLGAGGTRGGSASKNCGPDTAVLAIGS